MANRIERKIYILKNREPRVIEYVQGASAVPIMLTLMDYDIPENATARVYVLKPSGKGEYDTATIEDNGILIDVKSSMFDETGTSQIQASVKLGDKTLITFSQEVDVSPNKVPGEVPESENKSNFLDEYMEKMDGQQKAASEALAKIAEQQEAVEESASTASQAATKASESEKKAEESAEKAAKILQDVRDFESGLAVTPTATGSQIVAHDTAEWPLQALTVYGRTEQVQTSGAQLIDFSRVIYQRCTLVDAKTGTIKSNINNEYFCTIYINYLNEYFFANLGKTFSFQTDNNPTGTDVIIVVYGERTSGNWFQSSTTKGTGTTITIAEDFTSISQVELRVNRSAATFTDTSTLISGLMLYEGSEEKAYEPYTGGKPAPSPDYPQPIVSAGERLSTGKNLFNPDKYVEIALALNKGCEVVQFDGRRCLHITTNAYDKNNPIFTDFLEGQYTMFFDIYILSITNSGGNGFAFGYDDGKYTSVVPMIASSETNKWLNINKTSEANKKLTRLITNYGSDSECYIDLDSIQLEKGATATAYEPYTGGVPAAYPVGIEVAVSGKNLFDISIRDLISSGYDVVNATLISQTETGVVVQGNVGSSSGGDAGYSNGWYRPGNNQQSKNKLYLKKGTTVTVSADYTVLEFRYDNRTANQNRIGVHLYTYAGKQNYVGTNINIDTANKKYRVTNTFTITTEDGLAYYPVFSLNSNKVQIDNIQIEIGSTATPYEPYRGRQTVTLASNGLPGIQASDGKSYADTIEYRDGQAVYVQRVWSKTFTGGAGESWIAYNHDSYHGFYIRTLPESMSRRDGLCNLLNVHVKPDETKEGLWLGVDGTDMYVVRSSFYDATLEDKGLANWKAYLAAHPMTVMTYLTTPVETPLTDAEAAQLAALHTYKPTTTITNDAGVGMDVTYVADTKVYIDNQIAALQTAIATTNAQLI